MQNGSERKIYYVNVQHAQVKDQKWLKLAF